MTRPPVFQAETHEQALQRAAAEGRWAIVVVTASSSELGAMMERTSWQDARVGAWIAEKAVATRVDVGSDELLARRLGAKTLPTVIAYKDGAEKARHEGFLDAQRLRLWFLSLEGGLRKEHSLMRSKGGDLDHDMQGRFSYARALLREGRHEEATNHFVWLWENMERVQPSMRGVRVSYMAADMERLAAADAAAHARFAALRDRAAAAADEEPAAARSRRDWVVLNEVLGEKDRTLAWFDAVKSDPRAAAALEAVSHPLGELLKENARWADLGRLHRDPLEKLAFHHQVTSVRPSSTADLPAAAREELAAVMAQQFRNAAATLVASLWAAGRTLEAQKTREEALRLDPSDEMRRTLSEGPVRDG